MSINDVYAGLNVSNISGESELTQKDYDNALKKISDLQSQERTIQDKIQKNSKSWNFFSKKKNKEDLENQLTNVKYSIRQQQSKINNYSAQQDKDNNSNALKSYIKDTNKSSTQQDANNYNQKQRAYAEQLDKLKDELAQCNAKLSERQGSLELPGLSEGGGRKSRKDRKGKTKRKGRKGKSKRRKSRR